MSSLLFKVKQNLMIDFDSDNELLEQFIAAAVSYAESYQHRAAGYYSEHEMSPTTELAVLMLTAHFYESRDGATGGFFADNVSAGEASVAAVDRLLRLDRDWKV